MQRERTTWEIDTMADDTCRLGAVRESNGVRFSLAVPQGEQAFLLLYRAGHTEVEAEIPFPTVPAVGDVCTMKVRALPWREYEYNFRIGEKVFTDPYARRIVGRERFGVYVRNLDGHEVRSAFAFSAFDWQNTRKPQIPWEEAVMYHLHVRNFTMHSRSGVRHKGTFRGLQEKIPYLKELGVNQVKLMPVCEFEEFQKPIQGQNIRTEHDAMEPGKNCWGYAQANYFAPKQSYAATKDAVRELREMVREFHAQGMEVLLDFYFPESLPQTMMLECLSHWMREYQIDGFHIFGCEDAARMAARSPMFARTKLLCSYFPMGSSSWNREKDQFRGCAEINDSFLTDMRRILKSDEGVAEQFAYLVRRNPEDHGVINYMTNHDGFTLQDLVSYERKHNEENGEMNRDGSEYNFSWNCGIEGETRRKSVAALRLRQKKNAMLLMLLSQGTPMLMAGDEFGNSQGGNNNPYCQDNETSWVDWGALRRQKEFFAFVKQALAFRREHEIFHREKELRLMDYRALGCPDLSYHSSRAWYGGFEYNSRQLGMLYYGPYAQGEESFYVIYNFHPLAQEFALPNLKEDMRWYVQIDTSQRESFRTHQEPYAAAHAKSCIVPARTILVLSGRRERGENADESDRTF